MQAVLHEKQLEVANDKHRFRVICAGRRWGKSTLAQVILLQWATQTPGLFWLVSPTYKQSKQIHWRGLKSIIPRDWALKTNEVDLSITLRNGSVIELKGAENPDNLRGVKLRGLVIDEIASIRNWDWLWDEVLRPTLTDYEAGALFISTPKGYNHFHDLYQLGQLQGDGVQHVSRSDYKSWRFTSYDNPFIPHSEIDKAREEVGRDTFHQEYLAEFTRFTGLILKDFDEQAHVHAFDIPEHSDAYFGQDFAVRGWTAAVPGFVDHQGAFYIPDNYKQYNRTVDEHAPDIRTMLEQHAKFEKYQGFGDPSGWNKTQQGFKMGQEMTWSLADEYLERDFPLSKANNDVTAGINHLNQLFRSGKLHIHPRCVELLDEIQSYQWKDLPVSQIGSREEPEEVRKVNDHLVDALRYLAFSKPEPAEKPVPYQPGMPLKFELKATEEKDADEDEDIFTPMSFSDIYDD